MSLVTLNGIVADYLATHSDLAERELQFYGQQPTLEQAVESAAMALAASGKRGARQRGISNAALERAHTELRRCFLVGCEDFESLMTLIEESVLSIDGIGQLYVYDTAVRIGAYLSLSPEHVYLHAGTAEGARALGFVGGDFIEVTSLPPAFSPLDAHQVHDCLSIYKSHLAALPTA